MAPEEAAKAIRRQSPDRAETSATANRRILRAHVYDQIDPLKAAAIGAERLQAQIETLIRRVSDERRLQISRSEEEQIAGELLDEMLGIGPIQPLLGDETVNDILVNGASQIFVERAGRLELTAIRFLDEEHVFNTAQRIAAAVGRRIDEANPMVDARLADGSRVNIITFPLAIDGTTISIRKFTRRNLTLETLVARQAMSKDMADLLDRAMRASRTSSWRGARARARRRC